MAYKKWLIGNVDKAAACALSEECDIDQFAALIALSRGYNDATAIDELFAEEIMLSAYYELPDIEKAAQIINSAIADNKKICIFGDYDCDGVTATALLYSYLTERGASVTYHIPDRFCEGYGMNDAAVKKAAEDGVELIITVDNGISCAKEIEYAKSLGISCIVTDHHLPNEVLPAADAVVDPHLKNSNCLFRDICGVFVAFKLVCALEGAEPEQLAYKYADLVAIGTVADVMPLKYENRDIVKLGVQAINNTSRSGIIALINAASLNKGSITANNITFGISPRINAAGRMDSADLAFKLLIEKDFLKASEYAEQLNRLNLQRQKTEQSISKEAAQTIENSGIKNDRIIVVSGRNWHKGVIGIAASRIVEKYGKPAIVLSIDDNGVVSGSGRSLEGFSLYDAVAACEECLVRFGGHALAAGVGLTEQNIPVFRKMINEYAKTKPMPVPILKLDCKLNPAALSLDIVDSLKFLEPFGCGNPSPLFALCGLTLERITPLSSGKHSKLLLVKGQTRLEAMAFSVMPEAVPFSIGDTVDLAVTVDSNEYMGKRSLSVVIKNWRRSDINEDELFREIPLYEAFCREENGSYPKVDREDVAAVYRAAHNVTAESLHQALIPSIGYFKTKIGLDVLFELGLIEEYLEGSLSKIRQTKGRKASLGDSAILQKLIG